MMTWIWMGLLVIVVIGAIMLMIGLIDGNRYVIKQECFELASVKQDCKFVMLSDLHGKVYGKEHDKLIEDIRKLQPDFIVIAGDLITANAFSSIETGIVLIRELSKDYRIYYALGNHETKLRERAGEKYHELMDTMRQLGVEILADTSCELKEYNICITGLELERSYYARFKKQVISEEAVEKHVGKAKEDMCNILLAHNPNYFETYAKWGADLVLSGHVHGGIMRLPLLGGVISPSLELFPHYDGGIFRQDSSVMLLGRGMGAHTIPLRFFNPAELYCISVQGK